MTRYFQSIVTGRPLSVGGRSFIFEPVEPMGGSWTGVLAVEDDAAASVLAADGGSVWEITEQKFDELKKKRSGLGTSPGLKSSPPPRPPPLAIEVVESAERVAAPTSSTAETQQAAEAKAVGPSVELKTTDKQPPPEPLLDTAPLKRKKTKAA
jgi:hypothetical protein